MTSGKKMGFLLIASGSVRISQFRQSEYTKTISGFIGTRMAGFKKAPTGVTGALVICSENAM
jgi:hypothetical protein